MKDRELGMSDGLGFACPAHIFILHHLMGGEVAQGLGVVFQKH
jgi:hypothetical protein